MVKPKTRNIFVLFHLFAASLLAPMFLMVAITGANYLLGFEGETRETPISLPVGMTFDAEADDTEEKVRSVLSTNELPADFDYLRTRPGSITTRPTSRDYVQFTEEDGVWSATLYEPNLQYSFMELHKGHGPQLFRTYQIVAGIVLFLVTIGGLVVGLMAKTYRRKTIYSTIGGTLVFAALAFLA
ncbi:hypothetical protein GRI38_13605 [Altererythrobacter aurantiacus]|uniref:PepSY-associated TM region n=1 Tax=Parapontixanthobacter aurantiacus TaxID=1463599 RepID=A0A844ZGT4_9SPHN|nr:hypothetical protein [Parapontixanthobacter aurantiacus]MXO87065.1 hypothetical protein [Parapontixanthobacter aurantiacus]